MNLEIIHYSPEYKQAIRVLNEMWLKKYFRIEDSDVVQLGDPEGEILDQGGYIFYARVDGQIVGVSALMRVNSRTFELSKMAVEPKFQGNGIGRGLAKHCIEYALTLGARKLILYTNSRLEAAIHLYKEFGFVGVDLGNEHYERADKKMELDLTLYQTNSKDKRSQES